MDPNAGLKACKGCGGGIWHESAHFPYCDSCFDAGKSIMDSFTGAGLKVIRKALSQQEPPAPSEPAVAVDGTVKAAAVTRPRGKGAADKSDKD